jgi:CBS domain containing-hemolysin-like protein
VIAASLAGALLSDAAQVLTVIAMTFSLFVFAELVPEALSRKRAERIALSVAGVVYVLGRTLRPLGRSLLYLVRLPLAVLPSRKLPNSPFSEEPELRNLVDAAEQEEDIETEERELIHSIFEFGDTVVREVMVPRTDMVVVEGSCTLREALDTITKAGYSRIPIFEGDTDNIIGVLYAKDLLKRSIEINDETQVAAVGRPPLFVPEQKKVADLLREMQQQRVHMAIVVDEYGGTAGLVTIEDLIEEIVGEIVDEYDQEEPLVEPLDSDSIRVSAKLPIDEVNEMLDVELPHEEWDTVGGLVFGLTGRVPAVGESVSYDSIKLTTERVTGRRIQKVVITKTAESDKDADRG